MVRKCSHCGNIGHNSRTCTTYKNTISTTSGSSFVNNGIRLFGVQLELSSSCPSSCCSHVNNNNIAMKKCFSLDCLLSPSSPPPPLLNYSSPSPSPSSSSRLSINENNSNKTSAEYLSDGIFGRAQERKKGVAWTEEEHRKFLSGLEKLGKGDWRGISKNFVPTRTPTQVASHAQKYFLRQSIMHHKKKRRSSLFDMIGGSNKPTQSQAIMSNSKPSDTNNAGGGDDQYLTRTNSHHVESDSSQLQVSHNKAMPTWPCGSSPTSHTNSSSNKSVTPLMKSISPNEAPNLELTLAPSSPTPTPTPTPTPRPFYQDNSTPASLLFGPISVI